MYDGLTKEIFDNFIAVSLLPFRKKTLEFSRGELAVLYQLYINGTGLSAGRLGELIGIGSGRMADALKSLEAKHLILRKRDKADKRRVIVTLSAAGREKVEKRRGEVMEYIRILTENLGESDAKRINEIMKKIVTIYNSKRRNCNEERLL